MLRAREALATARVLVDGGHHEAAVNRAYYAAFYACLALLKSIGLEAKTHDGVRSLVSQHFVRGGKLPAETSTLLSHLAADRYDADYDLAAVITPDTASGTVRDAAQFIDEVARVLAEPARS